MTGVRRRTAVAAVLVTAAVALLGGCGSGGHGGGADHRPSVAAGAPTGPAASGGSNTSDSSEAPGSAADGPKVPDDQLTPPGGGSFSTKDKKYLSGRVPKGDDPVAVLEGGQEVCERLTRTSAIDPAASASAIVTGDISRSGATAAVRTLCPDQRYVLDAAARGFADGSFAVAAAPVAGRSVAPGRYQAPAVSPSCTWRVTGAHGKTLASGSTGTAAKAVLTVPATAETVTSSGCYAWLPPLAAPARSATASPTPSGGTS